MCQDKNEVINYYRYISIPGQVRVRLVRGDFHVFQDQT